MKIGIIGAGQLARMLALAAHPLNIECICMGVSKEDCAGSVSTVRVIAANDEANIADFARSVDVITFENENVEVAFAETLLQYAPLYPGVAALQLSQDRLLEKRGLQALGIPVAPFMQVNAREDLLGCVQQLGFPSILKTRRFGYDGKGQYRLTKKEDIEKAWNLLGAQPLILEGFVDFECEVSIIGVRRKNGDTAFYPLTQNTHQDGVLRLSMAPYVNQMLQIQAQRYAKTLMGSLDYVGVLAIEFFVTKEGLVANEIAPRVHNSGHWTIEGAHTSQFENHVRAICDLPLGSTDLVIPSMMINCLGEMPAREFVLQYPQTHFHDYQKTPRAGRKVGHVTVCSHTGFYDYQMVIDKLT